MDKQEYNSRVEKLKGQLIVSSDFLKASLAQLDYNIEDARIVPSLYDVQRLYLEPILGTALYQKLQEGNPTFEYQMLAEDYVWDVLIHWAAAEVIKKSSINIAQGGAFKHLPSDSQLAEKAEIDALAQSEFSKAADFETRLVDFLERNHTYYPEYKECMAGGIPSKRRPTANYHGNWYLGNGTSCASDGCADDGTLFLVQSNWGNSNEADYLTIDPMSLPHSSSTMPNQVTAQPVDQWFWLITAERADIYQAGVKIPLGSFDDANQLTQVYVYGEHNGSHYIRINIADTYQNPVSFDVRKY